MKLRYQREYIDENHLGWLVISEFSSQESLIEITNSYEFTDEYNHRLNRGKIIGLKYNRPDEGLVQTRYALSLNNLSNNNYEKLTADELIFELEQYGREDSWAEDVKFYRKGIYIIEKYLSRFKFSEILYGNVESPKMASAVSEEGLFYSYYINILMRKSDKIISVIDFGGD